IRCPPRTSPIGSASSTPFVMPTRESRSGRESSRPFCDGFPLQMGTSNATLLLHSIPLLLVLIPVLAACSVAPALLAEDPSAVGARCRSYYAGKYTPEPSEVLPK